MLGSVLYSSAEVSPAAILPMGKSSVRETVLTFFYDKRRNQHSGS
jgi:hypothetical protein